MEQRYDAFEWFDQSYQRRPDTPEGHIQEIDEAIQDYCIVYLHSHHMPTVRPTGNVLRQTQPYLSGMAHKEQVQFLVLALER